MIRNEWSGSRIEHTGIRSVPRSGDERGAGRDEPLRYEHEFAAGTRQLWTLRREEFTVEGRHAEDVNFLTADTIADVERHIQDLIDERSPELTRMVMAGQWFRHLYYRDGSRTDLTIAFNSVDWRCLDCGADMFETHEYYMVHNDLWLSVVPNRGGHLCVGCLEDRLGRRLEPTDFVHPSINGRFTDRLRDRTGIAQPEV